MILDLFTGLGGANTPENASLLAASSHPSITTSLFALMIYSCQEQKAGEISPFSLRGGGSGKVHISEIERVLLAKACSLLPQHLITSVLLQSLPLSQPFRGRLAPTTLWLTTHRETLSTITVVRNRLLLLGHNSRPERSVTRYRNVGSCFLLLLHFFFQLIFLFGLFKGVTLAF